ncbi:hypothetical protein [Sphingosinithalassobacter sp. CS137]|uniref:hypothetical protein n=1 Tax=Sphingosinithalassobacter sp. CS137 TaxID=2762748 RepID=UPI00165DA9F8|nr:hypothetical protein [Sphingosinithalassobacter sp. CS137]
MNLHLPACAAAALLLALAGCSEENTVAVDDTAVATMNETVLVDQPVPLPADEMEPAEAPVGTGSATQGGDGSPLVLAPLAPEDGADLEGELACSFAPERGGTPVLLGKGTVGVAERPQAVVRLGDTPQRLIGAEDGGFGYLTRGGRYSGRGLTVTITRDSEISTGHEGSLHGATLLAQRGDGAERSWEGFWTCGP